MIQYMLDCFIPSTPQWVEDRIKQQPILEYYATESIKERRILEYLQDKSSSQAVSMLSKSFHTTD
jgi:hypothetical protein